MAESTALPEASGGALVWRTVAASVQGSSHIARNEPCQDASAITVTDSGRLIVVVADGAGSACRAREGSALAVDAAMRFLERVLADDCLAPPDLEGAVREAFTIALDAIARQANEEQLPIRDFHTTLVCLVVTEQGAAAGHIGDSVAVVARDNDALELAAFPEHGEYVNTTYFLTMLPDIPDRLHTRQIDGRIDAVALSSDGLLEVAFTDPYGACEPVPGFFGTLFRRMRAEQDNDTLQDRVTALLKSPKIRGITSDDVTLAMAVRIALPEEPVEQTSEAEHPANAPDDDDGGNS